MDIINNAINSLNSSTFFAGIMMICLNIGSRYIQLNLDESTESYIKYALTKEILVFTISWMATRNIYSALVLTAVFVVLADFILNETHKNLNNIICATVKYPSKSEEFKTEYISKYFKKFLNNQCKLTPELMLLNYNELNINLNNMELLVITSNSTNKYKNHEIINFI